MQRCYVLDGECDGGLLIVRYVLKVRSQKISGSVCRALQYSQWDWNWMIPIISPVLMQIMKLMCLQNLGERLSALDDMAKARCTGIILVPLEIDPNHDSIWTREGDVKPASIRSTSCEDQNRSNSLNDWESFGLGL